MEISGVPKLTEYKISKGDFNEEEDVYVLELISTKSFIKINSKTKMFMDEIDGKQSYYDIANSYNEKFKTNITEDMVKNIIDNKFAKIGLIKGTEEKRERTLKSRLWVHWNLMDGKVFENIASKCTFLFKPLVMITLLMVTFISWAIVLNDANFLGFMAKKNINYFQSFNLFVIFIMLLFSSLFHEFGHIVASFKYNVKPRKVGVGLYLLMPVFFVELSEAWILDRKKRCIIDLGGVYFQIISVLIYSPMVLFDNYFFNITNYKIIIYATLTNVLFNLNPTLKMDGYWALSDFTGIVNIHFRTKRKLINLIKNILRLENNEKEEYKLTASSKKIFKIWSMLYAIITLVFIYIGISKLIVFVSNESINLRVIILGVGGYLFLRLFISFLRGKLDI